MQQKKYDKAVAILSDFEQKKQQFPLVYNMFIDIYTEQKKISGCN